MRQDLSIEYRPLNSLTPYAGNARTHPKKQIELLKSSILSVGFTNPILVDETGEIIAGHGRLAAAKELKLSSVPVIRLERLTTGQKRALRLADNKIALGSGWDTDLLKIELKELSLETPDLVLMTGFSLAEADQIISACPSEPDDEAIPATTPNPVTRWGDIWSIKGHVIGCGDTKDPACLDAVMGGRKADCAFLDPPYNVKIDGHAGGKGKHKHREFAEASGEMSEPQFIAYLTATLSACARVSRSGAVHFVCMDHHHVGELNAAGEEVYDKRLNICVWNKSNAGMGSLYRCKHELVFVYRVGEEAHYNAVELGRHGRNRTNVWDYASVNTFGGSRRHDLALHPTVKPVSLVADAIRDVTRRGEVVLDAFLGSGTTLIACERAGRVCRGLEIDPIYVDLALDRFCTLFGGEPVLAGTGQTFTEVRAERLGAEETAA